MTRKKKLSEAQDPADPGPTPDPTPSEPSPPETLYSPQDTTGNTLPSPLPSVPPETITLPMETIRNLALELATVTERLNRLEAAVPGAAVPVTSMTAAAPRSRLDALMDMVGQIAGAAQKVIPQQSASTELQNRLVDMALRGIDQNNQMAEVVKMGIAKQLGIDVAPKPMHIVTTQ